MADPSYAFLQINWGAQTPPAVPASTVSLTNPFPCACLVTVRGGTVSLIQVDGVSILGVLNGLVLVPEGKQIAVTYTLAPSWDWFGLT